MRFHTFKGTFVAGLSVFFIFLFTNVLVSLALEPSPGPEPESIPTEQQPSAPVADTQPDSQITPQFAPAEVIVKLKEQEPKELLFSQTYSTREPKHTAILSALETKYNLHKDRAVFTGLHNVLKAENLSQDQLLTRITHTTLFKGSTSETDRIDLLPIYVLKTDEDVFLTVRRLNQDPDVEYAQPNYLMQPATIPNDPYYSSSGSWGQDYDDLWGLKSINCQSAWDTSEGQNIIVAVIDTGIDYTHQDLAANVWLNTDEIPNNFLDDDHNGYIDDIRGYDISDGDNDVTDYSGHGTHCAGTIAAVGNNNRGVIGVAPQAKIMPVKIFPNSYSNVCAEGIRYAAANGADVLSNSWGTNVAHGADYVIEEAISEAYNQGCIIVFAAGNKNTDVKRYSPQNSLRAIAVAASNHHDQKADFSNYGYLVDVAAPGGDGMEIVEGLERLYYLTGTICSCFADGDNVPEELWDEFQTLFAQMIAAGTLPTEVAQYYGLLQNDGFSGLAVWRDFYRALKEFVITKTNTLLSLLAKNSVFAEDDNASLRVGEEYFRLKGTSMACPHTAGLAALILATNPNLSPEEVRQIIRITADDIMAPGPDIYSGYGRINAASALSLPSVCEASISSPAVLSTLKGEVAIEGAACGLNFLDYKLEYSPDRSPFNWQPINTGLVTNSVADGALAFWDTTQVENYPYFLRLTVQDCHGKEYRTLNYVTVYNCAPGWPVITGDSSTVLHSFAVGDIGLEPGKEAVSTSADQLYAWSADGKPLFTHELPGLINRVPSLGDLDNDGELEIVIRCGKMYLVDDGQISILVTERAGVWQPIVLDDLNADGWLEIVEIDERGHVYVRDRFGEILPNWPQKPLAATLIYSSEIATGDLDRDGIKEIVVQIKERYSPAGPVLYVLNFDGSVKWSYQLSDYDNTLYATVLNDVVLGDVDNDGFLEVVYFYCHGNSALKDTSGYVFDHNGNIQAHWIIPASQGCFIGALRPQIALGDLDGDRDLEIVMPGRDTAPGVIDGRVFAWHHNGQAVSGFPVEVIDESFGALMVADVDNNGFADIVSSLWSGRTNTYYNSIFAWNNAGQLLNGWPLHLLRQGNAPTTSVPPYSQTTLADLDADGKINLIAPIGSGEIHNLNLDGLANPMTMDWPMYRHDPQRTGCHKRPQAPVISDIPDMSMHKGLLSPLIFTVDAQDPDRQSMSLSFRGFPKGTLAVTPQQPTVTGQWQVSFQLNYRVSIGDYLITATVTDEHGLTDSATFTLTVKALPRLKTEQY